MSEILLALLGLLGEWKKALAFYGSEIRDLISGDKKKRRSSNYYFMAQIPRKIILANSVGCIDQKNCLFTSAGIYYDCLKQIRTWGENTLFQ